MKDAKDLLPWKVTDISIRPYDDYWSFNNCIHFDGVTYRCVLRCADYAMPNGTTVRSKSARAIGQQTKNAMVILDPTSWKPAKIFKMEERDNHPRTQTPHLGYEDMRIFRTDKGGLQGIAAALHLKRDRESVAGAPQNKPPEQVLLSFDAEYNIVKAQPIRGDSWSGTPQKNWSPFDHCVEPRFLYSIDKGTLFGEQGPLNGDAAIVLPSRGAVTTILPAVAISPLPPPVVASPPAPAPAPAPKAPAPKVDLRSRVVRGGDVQITRGRRLSLDASSSRPSSMRRPTMARADSGSTRVAGGGGHVSLPRYNGLRGGTQLVRVGDDAWLGVGHDMKFNGGRKFYWHVIYLCDARGKMKATSEPMKLAPNGIEFAAGMAIDGDRLVVSFGVDDAECKIGETSLSAVMGILKPV